MGLIDLKTDLKSLRYGSDAPYITKDINNPPSSNQLSMQVTKRVDDLSRIAQLLVDKPGLKYLGNEALLQQVNLGSTIDKARKGGKSIAGAVLQQVGKTAVGTAKILGSTLAQVPVAGTGLHFLKGFRTNTYLEPTGGSTASAFAQFFGAGGIEGAPYALRGEVVPGAHKTELLTNTRSSNFDYVGGDVFLDRNETLNTPIVSDQARFNAQKGAPIKVDSTGSLVVGDSSKGATPTKKSDYQYNGTVYLDKNESKQEPQPKDKSRTSKESAERGTPISVGGRQTTVEKGKLPGSKAIDTPGDFSAVSANKVIKDFRRGNKAPGSAYVGKSGIKYASQNMESRITIGRQGKDRSGDSYKSRDGQTVDRLNELSIGTERQDGTKEARDLAKFFFEIITPDDSSKGHGNFIHFRAYIDSIDDSYTADWQGHRYVGRAENFLTYGGFDRDISISFKIAAMTRSELKPLYQKMVYLASTTAPSYSDTFMRGTVVKLSVGSYFVQQPGVITSVKYSLIGDMPWEIAMQGPEGGEADVQELPMGLQCSVSFKPIHNFAPQTGLFNYFTSDVNEIKFFEPTEHVNIKGTNGK